ncbi:preprotein translocase subunit SecE [Glycocaulis sp.]
MAKAGKTGQPARTGATGQGSGTASGGSSAPARKKTTNPFRFLGEVRQEGRKVTWTSRGETIVSSIFVLVLSVIAAIFFFGVDSLIGLIVNFLLGLGA